MVHRAHVIPSTSEIFNEECARLRSIFRRLNSSISLVNSTMRIVANEMLTITRNSNQVNNAATIRTCLS